jgi:hypothetical protein
MQSIKNKIKKYIPYKYMGYIKINIIYYNTSLDLFILLKSIVVSAEPKT